MLAVVVTFLAVIVQCMTTSNAFNPSRLSQTRPASFGLFAREDSGRGLEKDDPIKFAKESSTRRAVFVSLAAAGATVLGEPAYANSKSRTDGYEVQKTNEDWRRTLSPLQYQILREGGTERPFTSILESEKRPGVFHCAGCDIPLFDSQAKFNSGTGWPSFAEALPGVEVEKMNPVRYQLGGAELRCKTCGGHLGDVFADGYLFVGTEAAKTGKRYCIDGSALVFYPNGGDDPLRGDLTKPVTQPNWLEPPSIVGRSREEE